MSVGSLDRKTLACLVKLSVFATVAVVLTVVIAATIRPIGDGGTATYSAVFTSASQLQKGDQVRVAGVVVGSVSDVEVTDDAQARVTFTASKDLRLTTGTQADIYYLNLVGNRYVSLVAGSGAPLAPGGAIPVANTKPALDLDLLFNGFKPLFNALSPDDVNGLAADIVQTLQGEGGTVDALLQHTARLTSTLADRDEVIGRVIDNLGTVFGTLDRRDGELNDLVVQLDRYLTGLASERDVIGRSLVGIDKLSSTTAGLLRQARPHLRSDVASLGRLASALDGHKNLAHLRGAIERLPSKLDRLTRVASYGSWFNFYLCDVEISVVSPSAPGTVLGGLEGLLTAPLHNIRLHDTSPRCRE